MHEINIYGDIVAFNYLNDGTEYDLKNLKESLSKLSINKGDTLTINIHTYGGNTTTAFGMYNLIKRFKNDYEVNIRTRVDGYCASAGVILLLAGDKDKRVGNQYLKPFIHNAWVWQYESVSKEDAKKVYEELTLVDNVIAELYASETSITKEEALQFMGENRDLTTDECLKYGFYSELENVTVIDSQNYFNPIISMNTKNRKNNLINNSTHMDKKRKNAWNALMNQARDFFKGVQNKIVFTATNEELDFYELEESDTPTVGDKAIIDGKPAGEVNGGVFVMSSGETYKFEGEELKEIIEKEDSDSEDELKAENEALKSEIQELKEEIEALKSETNNMKQKVTEAKNIIKGFNSLIDEGKTDYKPRMPKPILNEKKEVRAMFENLIK